ncbi:TPA: hypothetical protein O4F91_001713 [Vibrio alginolyticus]|uniref:hypothetical protein n=1 Tax=Vibrio sp. YT-17 TaxID=3074708 RepID=UPI002964C441|nr:hypothetical protein [Vibrio sp. YT-17]MDW1542760.1 hypothetical protein [Vibrio sp. YT-17]HCZ9035112.1 hypothetical protein [Vibrio alginolyticus]HCZ9053807.1 hypothetical protein [Vibrio alginolyticus]
MQYQLTIAYLNDNDLRPERPTIPEIEDADVFIRAFVEDINLFACTESADLEGMVVTITLAPDYSTKDLHAELTSMNPRYVEMFKTTGLSQSNP